MPLFWLATAASILLARKLPAASDLFLNLTGLFGFFRWNVSFATGAWSIGNELTFYVAFPLVLALANGSRYALGAFGLSIAALYVYFAFHAVQPNLPLASQWPHYTNPLNQLPFFVGGVLMGRFVRPAAAGAWFQPAVAAGGLALFVLLPVGGEAVALVTNWPRIVFLLSCFAICYGFFRTAPAPPLLDKPLAWLGRASYSVYLLHPLVFAVTKVGGSLLASSMALPAYTLPGIAGIISLGLSYFSYQYFEKYFIKISHR